jgi:nitroreductase
MELEANQKTYDIKNSVDSSMIKMNVFEAIATRRSIRKFTSSDIPMEILGVLLDAMRYAPSAGNIQSWRFIVCKTPAKKQQVAEACMQQYWIAEAPFVIVLVNENEKITNFFGLRGERLYSVQNCAAAAQNFLLTAHALGLASCWVSEFDEDMLKRACGIPGNVRPQVVLPVGYPDEIVPAPSRYPMDDLTYFETYGSRYTNIERILQNPLVFDKVSRLVGSLVDAAKDVIEKKKK